MSYDNFIKVLHKEGGPFHPTTLSGEAESSEIHLCGLTYRQWLTGLAMQAAITRGISSDPQHIAGLSVEYADTIIARLRSEIKTNEG